MTELNKVNFNKIKMIFPTNILIFGPTMSGKSFLIKKIIDKYSHKFDYIFGFGRNFKDFNKMTRFADIDIDILNEIWETNKALQEDNKKPKNILIVFDDILGENFHNGQEGQFWNEFLSTCRHQNITCLFSIQHMSGINPAMRKNLLYIIITDIDNETVEKVKPYTNLKTNDLLKIELKGYEAIFISRRKTTKLICIIKE